jgi:hypothetical protein
MVVDVPAGGRRLPKVAVMTPARDASCHIGDAIMGEHLDLL